MTILTDAIVEKSARALHELGKGSIETCRAEARACLAAALPDIVEQCAKTIEDTQSRLFAITHHQSALNIGNVKRELGDRIRALIL